MKSCQFSTSVTLFLLICVLGRNFNFLGNLNMKCMEFDNYSISPQATFIEMASIFRNVQVLILGLNHLDDPDYAIENRD